MREPDVGLDAPHSIGHDTPHEGATCRSDQGSLRARYKHIGGAQAPYAFKDVPTLIRDFLQDVQETES